MYSFSLFREKCVGYMRKYGQNDLVYFTRKHIFSRCFLYDFVYITGFDIHLLWHSKCILQSSGLGDYIAWSVVTSIPEDRGSNFLQYVGNHLSDYTVP